MNQEKVTRVWSISPTHGIWPNQDLMKDCGMVPYMFHKVYGFIPTMLGRRSGEYPYLALMPGLRMEFLPVGEAEYHSAKMQFLHSHYEEMDMLTLTGPYFGFCDFLPEYKRLRPDGKVYMGLDMNSTWANMIGWRDPWITGLLDNCDVIATSCRKMADDLNQRYGIKPIHCIPNGFYNLTGQPINASLEQKENIILTIGRLGTEQKANHVLLETFAAVHKDIPDWRVILIGTIDERFRPYMEQYFERYPELREKVIFKGLIEDKKELFKYYTRAKIFALTSIHEGGAPNVVAEALNHGCYMVTSSIDAADEVTNHGDCGSVFPIGDNGALANIFRNVCANDSLLRDAFPKALAYADSEFDWVKNIKRLHGLLFK
jgi:glycosyltransferase involved in cell wall biosynthesis